MDLSTIVLPTNGDEQGPLEVPDASNQGTTAEEQILQQPPEAAANNRDSERFYCPYPGCNRSFAELWRLKVHYRAPPDIRGSGKERGHGTELGFCPKCGKALKPGKHHVGCSAGRATPRQAKRKVAEDGDGEGTKRQESLPQPYPPWIDPATAQAAAQAAAAAAAAAAAGMPLNGAHYPPLLPPHLSGAMPSYPPGADASNFYSQHHHAAAAAAVAAAAAAFASPYGPGYPPQFPMPGFPPMPGTFPPPYPGAPPPHPMVPPPPQPQSSSHQPPLPQLPAPPTSQQQMSTSQQPAPSVSSQQQQPAEHQDSYSRQPPHSMHSTPATSGIESSEPEFLAGIFDDLPEFNRVVPSPPPLPEDFHMNSGPNRLLFNFSQFSHKMPHSLHDTAAKELTDKEVLDLAEQHVVYDHTDDGELMQMLFGMADDMPTMATIHLHAWHNVDEEAAQQQAQAGAVDAGSAHGQGSSSQLPMRGAHQQGAPAPTGHRQDMRSTHSGPQAHQQGHGQEDHRHSAPPAADGQQAPNHATEPAKKQLEGSTGDFMSKLPDILGNCGDERDHVLEAEMHHFLQSVE